VKSLNLDNPVRMSRDDYSRQFLKTRMCRFHADARCFKGADCSHAHSREELVRKPNLKKTSLCRHWSTTGSCEKDLKCPYAHGESELRSKLSETPLNLVENPAEGEELPKDQDLSSKSGTSSSPTAASGEKEGVQSGQIPFLWPPAQRLPRRAWYPSYAHWSMYPPPTVPAAYQYPYPLNAPSRFAEDDSPRDWQD
jgi:hypothetical protein